VVIELSARDRYALNTLLASTSEARILRRAYALKQLDEGTSVEEISSVLQVSRQSVYSWLKRMANHPDQPLAERLRDGTRRGRPCTLKGIIDPWIDSVIDASPFTYGYQATTWTAALLVAYLKDHHGLVASVPSVRLALARLKIRWKRPRHTLALRPTYWRQAKGG
jgi:transposase